MKLAVTQVGRIKIPCKGDASSTYGNHVRHSRGFQGFGDNVEAENRSMARDTS
jgi:hypothetical protein